MTIEVRLIGSKKDLKLASTLLYSALGSQFAMRNIFKGQKGDYVARAELVLVATSASTPNAGATTPDEAYNDDVKKSLSS